MDLAITYLNQVKAFSFVREVKHSDITADQGRAEAHLMNGIIVHVTWDKSRDWMNAEPLAAAEAMMRLRTEVGLAVNQPDQTKSEKVLRDVAYDNSFLEDRPETNPNNLHKTSRNVGRIRLAVHAGDVRAELTRFYNPALEGDRDDAIAHLCNIVTAIQSEH